ncbi:MAG: RNA polymerase-binding transcription factor DksA [Phycisphaerae bacterium]|nr:RNA polymerase-binding transcription factor DksA [Phycisphaerae bacterium]
MARKVTKKAVSQRSSRKPAARTPARTNNKAAAKTAPKLASRGPAAGRKPAGKPAVPPPPPPPAVESGLTSRDIAELRQALLLKRSQLIGDVTTLHKEALRSNRQDASGDLSSMPIHMADIGTDNYEQEFTLGLIEGERKNLREIEAALERIERGTYGLCQATGRPIGKARLKANPWAKFCYEYTLEQERGMQRRF